MTVKWLSWIDHLINRKFCLYSFCLFRRTGLFTFSVCTLKGPSHKSYLRSSFFRRVCRQMLRNNFSRIYPPTTIFPPYPASWKNFLQALVVGVLACRLCLCHYTNKYMRRERTAFESRGKYIFGGIRGQWAGKGAHSARFCVLLNKKDGARSARARTRGQKFAS